MNRANPTHRRRTLNATPHATETGAQSAPRRLKTRIVPYIPDELAKQLSNFCRSNHVTISDAVSEAVEKHLGYVDDRILILRKLDRSSRATERLHRDLLLFSECFARWIQMWFAHTPEISKEERVAAQAQAVARYERFIAHVGTQFAAGKLLIDDIAKDVADDSELAAVVKKAEEDAAAMRASSPEPRSGGDPPDREV